MNQPSAPPLPTPRSRSPPPPYSYQNEYPSRTFLPPQPAGNIILIAPGQSFPVGSVPVRIICPACRAHVQTMVIHQPTMKTHLCALLLCFCICWPCVCLPYCMKSCRNANHYCPNCNAFIGTYQS